MIKTVYKVGFNVKFKRDAIIRQVGAKVTYYRILKGLNQSELAKRAHISRGALNRIENGHYDSNISLDILFDLAEVLDIDFSLLVSFNDTERKMWTMDLQE